MSDESSEWDSSISLWSSLSGEELDISISNTLDLDSETDRESESGSESEPESGDEQYYDAVEFLESRPENQPLEDEEYPDVDKFLKEISEDPEQNAQIIEQLKKNMLKIFKR